MSGLELRFLILAFDGDATSDGLLGVLLVYGEWGNSLVVAKLGRVRWLEGPVVLDGRRCLRLGFPVGNRDVLLQHPPVCVEEVRLLDLL